MTRVGMDSRDAVLDICAEVFNVDGQPTGPGLTELGFLELGGTSLQAMRILARVREAMGVEASLLWLYEAGTLREFADVVAAAEPSSSAPTHAVSAEHRPSLLQEGMFVAAEQGLLSLRLATAAFRVIGPLDVDRLARAANLVAAAHDSLRTSFVRRDGRVCRQVHDRVAVPVTVEDAPPAADPWQEPDEVAWIQQTLVPFELDRAPLFRIAVRRVQDGEGAERHVLLLLFDHIVVDGWSMQVLLADLGAAYAHADESGYSVGVGPVTFAAWADQQRAQLSGDRLTDLVGHWRAILGDDPGIIGTPLPGYRIDRPAGGAGHLDVAVADPAAVRSFSRALGVTTFATLLAAFARAVCAETGLSRVFIQTSTANRRHEHEARIVGPLFHHLHLLLDLTGTADLAGAATRAHAVVVEATEFGEVPHPVLRGLLWPDPPPRSQPIVYFAVNPPFGGQLGLADLEVTPLEYDWLAEPPGTETWIVDDADTLTGTFRWERGRLDERVCRAIVTRFEEDLATLTDQPRRDTD